MPNNHRSLLRRLLPTAHKLLLHFIVDSKVREVEGDVLVIGAGREPYRRLLVSAKSVCCTDIDAGEGVDLIADAHALPFPDASFDACIAIEVFEHLFDPKKAAAEMSRVLRDNGEAIVSVPFMFRIHGDPFDYQRFTKSGLEVLFENFSGVIIQPFGNRWHVVSDIFTTSAKAVVALRFLNHVLTAWPFTGVSKDCPSGYYILLRK